MGVRGNYHTFTSVEIDVPLVCSFSAHVLGSAPEGFLQRLPLLVSLGGTDCLHPGNEVWMQCANQFALAESEPSGLAMDLRDV